MKAVALAMLVGAAIVYVVATIVGADGAWGYVQAFAEAAMVGALADWFAVTALFRHPLRIPIPHTAIIPKRKDQLGRSLGDFVESNCLTHEVLGERLAQANVGARLGHGLAEPANARRVSEGLSDALKGTLEVLDDDEVLDVPDVGTIPVGDKTSIGVEDGNAVISTEIGGTRVDLRLPIGDRQTPSGQAPTPTPATPPTQPQPAPAPPP